MLSIKAIWKSGASPICDEWRDPTSLWAAAPMDELELSDAEIGLKIKLASNVSCAERNFFNLLFDFEDMWQGAGCRGNE
jgi:hypothetical protein